MTNLGTTAGPSGRDIPPDIPDLNLIRPIGQGGFGQVWLAANQTTGHLRAVKLIPLQRSGTTDPAGREITSLTRLEANLRRQHPNLLTIYHVGRTADHLFYVMDLADDLCGNPASSDPGYRPATLQGRLENGPMSPDECFCCAEQLLKGLASLHEAGMVHRDVKPANCLFVAGELKLADFGLLTEDRPEASRLGTQKYMPPDGRMDTRGDVYAAGLVIYEMITGLPPDRFPRLGEKAHELADSPTLDSLVRLVLRACRRDPQRRFRDAREMLAELKNCDLDAAGRHGRSRRRFLISGIVITGIVSLAIASWWFGHQRSPATPAGPVHVNFITNKPFFHAEVYLDGIRQKKADGTPYTTPCTIKNLSPRVYHVEFRRHDLPKLDCGRVDFAKTRQIAAGWPSEP